MRLEVVARCVLALGLASSASLAIIRPATAAGEERFAVYPEAPDEAETALSGGKPGAASVETAITEAEAAYARAQWSVAMERFRAVLAADPENAHALLRIGNLHQRRGQWLSAASSYRKAARRLEGQPDGQPMRTKALLNLAAVNFELALASLGELSEIPGAPSPPAEMESLRIALKGWLAQVTAPTGSLRAPPVSGPSARAETPSGARASEAVGASPTTIVGRPTMRAEVRQDTREDVRRDVHRDAQRDSHRDPHRDSRPDARTASESSSRLPAVEYLRPADAR